jgi:hypothetical protein
MDRPPRGFDIDAIGDGFEVGLVRYLDGASRVSSVNGGGVEVEAVLEAARVDAAFHKVARAPRVEPFQPSERDAARLASSCFELSPSVALVSERWPLCELRLRLLDQHRDEPTALGTRWPALRQWLVARRQAQIGLTPLEAGEAELLTLLQREPLERALAVLEAATPEAERALLPARTQAWLARSVQRGIWRGLR